MLERATRLLKLLHTLRSLWAEEMASPHRLRHVGLWRQGFLSDRHELYGLGSNDPAQYVSDLARIRYGRRVNPRAFTPILSNKLIFHEVLGADFAHHLPALLGVILRGRVHWRGAHDTPSPSPHRFGQRLAGPLDMVVKPISGGGGKGVRVLSHSEAGFTSNGCPVTAEELEALVGDLDGYLIEERLQQHRYAAAIYPDATNTLRVLVMRDPSSGGAFIPIAVHRFGNVASAPTDNFSQGGFSCHIDLESGTLGPGAALGRGGKLTWHRAHPATGAKIEGVTLPYWDDVKQLVLEVSDALPHLVYVGWDVVITEDGPKIIEGNHYMNPRVLQIHRPLLAEDRMRTFYQHHGLAR